MKYYVYILFSEKKGKYYVGYSEDIQLRLAQHKESYYKKSYTSTADDWIVIFNFECQSRTQAILIERHIKKMKSTKYIKDLIKYPEIKEKLIDKFS